MPTLDTRTALTTEAQDTDLIEVTRVGDKTYKQDRSLFMKKLRTLDGFTVSVDDDVYPRAEVEYLEPTSDWKFAAGVQVAGVTAQASIGCRNTVTTESLNVTINNGSISMKHVNTSGVTTASITVASGSIKIKGLPTSSAGLPAESLWNDGGTIKIV
jgi:hypothetical protein